MCFRWHTYHCNSSTRLCIVLKLLAHSDLHTQHMECFCIGLIFLYNSERETLKYSERINCNDDYNIVTCSIQMGQGTYNAYNESCLFQMKPFKTKTFLFPKYFSLSVSFFVNVKICDIIFLLCKHICSSKYIYVYI